MLRLAITQTGRLDRIWTLRLHGDVLPYCPDDQLLRELSAVVTAGWFLPSRPERSGDVRHLLQMADAGNVMSFRQAAQRVLTMLDAALKDGDPATIGEDDVVGLRILFGVHPDYRTEPSPVVRRVEASEYLVPKWRRQPPRNRAEAFQKRRQTGALRLALQCLVAAYGQEDRPSTLSADVVARSRRYLVTANRQITRVISEEVIRIRREGLTLYSFTEPRRDSPGVVDTQFTLRQHALGPPLTLAGIADDPTRDDSRTISLGLPRPYRVGELVGIAWTEDVAFAPDAVPYRRQYVSSGFGNDGFELDLTVEFAADVELPELAWWYALRPGEDLFKIGPRANEVLYFGAGRALSHRWTAQETERWLPHGIQWVWGPREDDWPPFTSRANSARVISTRRSA